MTSPRYRVKAPSRPILSVVPFKPWEKMPNPKAISMIEGLLEKAKSGEVQAVAIAAVRDDRGTITGYAGGFTQSLLSATAHLEYRLNQAVESEG